MSLISYLVASRSAQRSSGEEGPAVTRTTAQLSCPAWASAAVIAPTERRGMACEDSGVESWAVAGSCPVRVRDRPSLQGTEIASEAPGAVVEVYADEITVDEDGNKWIKLARGGPAFATAREGPAFATRPPADCYMMCFNAGSGQTLLKLQGDLHVVNDTSPLVVHDTVTIHGIQLLTKMNGKRGVIAEEMPGSMFRVKMHEDQTVELFHRSNLMKDMDAGADAATMLLDPASESPFGSSNPSMAGGFGVADVGANAVGMNATGASQGSSDGVGVIWRHHSFTLKTAFQPLADGRHYRSRVKNGVFTMELVRGDEESCSERFARLAMERAETDRLRAEAQEAERAQAAAARQAEGAASEASRDSMDLESNGAASQMVAGSADPGACAWLPLYASVTKSGRGLSRWRVLRVLASSARDREGERE